MNYPSSIYPIFTISRQTFILIISFSNNHVFGITLSHQNKLEFRFYYSVIFVISCRVFKTYQSQNNKSIPQMDNHQYLKCIICYDIAEQPVESMCCGDLICHQCYHIIKFKSSRKKCTTCQKNMQVKPSMVARKIIDSLEVCCRWGCQQKITNKDKQEHQRICMARKLKCKICQSQLFVADLFSHMLDNHSQQLKQLCIGYNQCSLDSKFFFINNQNEIGKDSECLFWSNMAQNRQGNTATIEIGGRYHCNEIDEKGDLCFFPNICEPCMQLTIKRYRLESGYLVNQEGSVCKQINRNRLFFCGKKLGQIQEEQEQGQGIGMRQNEYNREGYATNKLCCQQFQCYPCQSLNDLVQEGKYDNLI